MQSRIRTDLKFLIFSEIYAQLESPKTKRRAFGFIEAAIQCIYRNGIENVTLTMIARESGVSRQALASYFSDLDEILTLSIKYIRLLFQRLVLDATLKQTDSEKMLSAYVLTCFQWVHGQKIHAVVWFSFLQRCAQVPRFRNLNTAAVRAGEDRLTDLIERGRSEGFFHCSDPGQAAKLIQLIITGGVLSAMSENIDNYADYSASIERSCIAIAKPNSK